MAQSVWKQTHFNLFGKPAITRDSSGH